MFQKRQTGSSTQDNTTKTIPNGNQRKKGQAHFIYIMDNLQAI
jgi:hypothetical protein